MPRIKIPNRKKKKAYKRLLNPPLLMQGYGLDSL